MKTVLTIAGFDPSGGAGVLADIKTISRFGCYGVAAVTSLTIQNTTGVFAVYHQSADVVARQLRVIVDDFDISAVKIGMLPTREVVDTVVEIISAGSFPFVVVDPIITSTSGFDLIDDSAVAAIVDRLFPLADVVTPNIVEAERITGSPVRGAEQMKQAARLLGALGPRGVLVTGGDLQSSEAVDVLFDGDIVEYTAERLASKNTHGTGCAFSSALASLLASGQSLRESVAIAKRYVADAIKAAPGLGKGRGPLNHFPGGS